MGAKANSGVVTGNGKPQQRFGARKRLVVLILVGVVVVAVLAVGTALVVQKLQDNKKPKTTSTPKVTFTQQKVSVPTSSNYASDQKVLDTQIAQATTNEAKATLYIKKSDLVIINKGYTEDATTFAQKAEDLAPSQSTAFALANVAYGRKQTADAIKYYNLYLSRMTAEYKQANPGEYEHYQQIVQELQKQ